MMNLYPVSAKNYILIFFLLTCILGVSRSDTVSALYEKLNKYHFMQVFV